MDFMMEEKGDDFYGGVGNYQVFKGSGKIYKGHCSGRRALRANKHLTIKDLQEIILS